MIHRSTSMIHRILEKALQTYLKSKNHKIFFIWGPRRSGKTTLLNQLVKQLGVPRFNFDLFSDQEKFYPDKKNLAKLAAEHSVLLIDEVQNYPDSTLALKILHDEFGVKIIATGSSELRQKSQYFDTLAGRYMEHFCLPLSIEELHAYAHVKAYEEKDFLRDLQENLQIFGVYPEIHATTISEHEKIQTLQNILDTYVLKDVIQIYELKNAKLAKDILTKIALQIGYEVSLRELAASLSANALTVSNYIEIFIKNYILVPLPSFKTNLKKVVSAHRKLYFLDLGIRNILVRDFRPISLRPDKGGLFENFIVSEMYKKIRNHELLYSMYFYREYAGREVDLILETYKKEYRCFESKYYVKKSEKSAQKIFPLPHDFKVINSENYFQVVSEL